MVLLILSHLRKIIVLLSLKCAQDGGKYTVVTADCVEDINTETLEYITGGSRLSVS